MRLINVFVGSRPDNTMFAETSSPFFILTPEQIPSLIIIDSTFAFVRITVPADWADKARVLASFPEPPLTKCIL